MAGLCAGVPHQDVPQLRPRAVQGVRAAPLDRVHGVHRRGGRQEEQDRVRTEHLRRVGGEHIIFIIIIIMIFSTIAPYFALK